MKNLFCVAVLALCASGCEVEYPAGAVYPRAGAFEVCDDAGCRVVSNNQYYYVDGELYYFDARYSVWIGPRGYVRGGRFYGGRPYGYHRGSFGRGRGHR